MLRGQSQLPGVLTISEGILLISSGAYQGMVFKGKDIGYLLHIFIA